MSDTTVRNILKTDYQNLTNTTSGRKTKNDQNWNHVFKEDLANKIYEFHSKNMFFTLNDLLYFSKSNLEYTGSRSTLHKIVQSMGYSYKIVNNRKILCEQSHVITAKIKFLRKYIQYMNSSEKINFIYLDETWIYQNGSSIRKWVHDSNLKGYPSKFKGEGKRFTILHAGCAGGFLEGCDLLLDSNNNDRDYHKAMNSEIFKGWVKNQLIPALADFDGKCIIVMDNAPYHSVRLNKPPTFASKKAELQNWLRCKNIDFETNMTKKQLWDKIKIYSAGQGRQFEIDEMLRRHGYEVLRLPPYHCQYNPIELAWASCKNFYNKHINSQPSSKDKVMTLWRKALSLYTSDKWKNSIAHCEKEILDDWKKYMGNSSVDDIPPFIISLEASDDSESDLLESDAELSSSE